jgi:hypothetical protein
MSDDFLKELTTTGKNKNQIPKKTQPEKEESSDSEGSSIRKKIASRYKGPEGIKAQITARINQDSYFILREESKKLGISLGRLISDTLEEIYPAKNRHS